MNHDHHRFSTLHVFGRMSLDAFPKLATILYMARLLPSGASIRSVRRTQKIQPGFALQSPNGVPKRPQTQRMCQITTRFHEAINLHLRRQYGCRTQEIQPWGVTRYWEGAIRADIRHTYLCSGSHSSACVSVDHSMINCHYIRVDSTRQNRCRIS